MMTNEEFIKIISKSGSKQMVGGIAMLIIGILFGTGAYIGMDGMGTGGKIFLVILTALVLLIGIWLIIRSSKTASQIKKGEHPLINALDKNGDKSVVVWYYEQIITTNGVESHQIYIYDKNNKFIDIMVKKPKNREMMHFLSENFPDALVGFSKENGVLYKQRIS